jgi:hypothetical protein
MLKGTPLFKGPKAFKKIEFLTKIKAEIYAKDK